MAAMIGWGSMRGRTIRRWRYSLDESVRVAGWSRPGRVQVAVVTGTISMGKT